MILCEHWIGGRFCSEGPTRTYLVGHRCSAHTPAALAGRPDHQPDPVLTLDALRAVKGILWSFNPHDTALKSNDIATGKRRSSPEAYRAAQMDVEARKRKPSTRT